MRKISILEKMSCQVKCIRSNHLRGGNETKFDYFCLLGRQEREVAAHQGTTAIRKEVRILARGKGPIH